jgi:hypothetical protein
MLALMRYYLCEILDVNEVPHDNMQNESFRSVTRSMTGSVSPSNEKHEMTEASCSIGMLPSLQPGLHHKASGVGEK